MSKRIGLIGLTSNKNIGDYLLAESTKYILKKHSPDFTFVDIDIDPRSEHVYKGTKKVNLRIFEVMDRFEKNVFTVLRPSYFRYLYQYLRWWIKLNWYYKKAIKDVDALVFVGGGFIKFKTQGLNYLDEQIIKLAKKHKTPIMFNAMGIEGYDESDIRCRRLKKAINSDIVHTITTRDDLETLRGNYITNKNIVTDLVGDPVFWLKDMYPAAKISKLSNLKGSIGINLVNPNNFVRYGGSVNRYHIENFYKNLLQELNILGADYYLFTNGMEVDYRFGKRLIRSMNIPSRRLVQAPETSQELIDVTSSFDIILSARMHAGITAYALDVPIVGLIWSKKIDFFSKIAGIRGRYFDENELDYKKISNMLIDNNQVKPDEKIKNQLKSKTLKYLGDFADSVKAYKER